MHRHICPTFKTLLGIGGGDAAVRACWRLPAVHRCRSTAAGVLLEGATPPSDGCPKAVRPFDAIPGPKLWPIVGCLPDYIANDFHTAQFHKVWQWRYEDYGRESKIVAERVFHRQWVNVYSPDTVKQVFAQEGKYPMRPRMSLYYLRQDHLGYVGVALDDGERWKKERSLWNRKVLRPQAVEGYIPRINAITDEFMDHVRRVAGEEEDGRTADNGQELMAGEMPNLLREIAKYSLELMGSIVLSTRLGAIQPGLDLSVDAHRFMHENELMWPHCNKLDMSPFQLFRYLPSKTYRTMKRHWVNMFGITSKLMDEYRVRMKDTLESDEFEESTAPDVYSYFLAKDTPDVEVLSHIHDLLQVSLDTTPNAVQMLLYCIAKNPVAQEKLYKEVTEVLQGGKVTADNLKDLRYLKCCVKEASRMFMAIPGTSRILDHDIAINGYNVPKGTFINLCFQTMCQDKDIFDRPDEFLPERWLDVRKAPDVAYSHLPFGFGTRSCVGRRLVDQEMYILLANLISKFRIENLCTSEPDMKWFGIILTASEPIRLAFHKR